MATKFILTALMFCGAHAVAALVDEVDPFIGSTGGGNTFPGAVLPWGMVSVSPHNDLGAPAGYSSGKPKIFGFGHLHLSGVGCPDLGNIVLMPARVGAERKAGMTYSNELARPGYYSARFSEQGIQAEMSVTPRSGFSRYRFEARAAAPQVWLDLAQAMRPVTLADGKQLPDGSFEGFTQSGGFCGSKSERKVYFHAEVFPKPLKVLSWPGPEKGLSFEFKNGTKEVLVKIGISYVSAANASLNLKKENPGWDFEKVRAAAAAAWERELSKIEIKGGDRQRRQLFYTALYHVLLHPNVFSDVNGEYQGLENSGVKKAAKGERYSVFSLWDTYRTVHPLLTLLWPERQLDMARSLADMAKDSGWLPKWELSGDETYVMVGDPVLPAIADTYLAGLRDFDAEAAWAAAWKAATVPSKLRPGLKSMDKFGYIANDETFGDWVWGSVSSTLEYAYADWSLAQWARAMGKNKEADWLMQKRAPMWKALFDKTSGFLRAKLASGAFLSPFDPLAQCCDKSGWPDNGGPGYVEGNAWQYTWFVPHDMPGLIQAMGGPAVFTEKLQACFDKGQFVMWNEPDMAYPWLFNYVKGEEWRTRKLVREAAEKTFKAGPSGIPGNDDCGTTSGWYLFANMGFYPDCPGSGKFQVAAPLFGEIRLQLPKGKELLLKNRSLGADKGSLIWNGIKLEQPVLTREQLAQGGELRFQ